MANKKFSEFTLKTDSANVDFVVGYDGTDNVRIAPSNLSSGGASSLNGLSDVLIDTTSEYVGTVPASLSGNPQGNTFLGINAGASNTSAFKNTLIGNDAGTATTSGSFNTVLGYQAAYSATTTSQSVNIGFQAGYGATEANSCVNIGMYANHDINGRNKSGATAIGKNSMYGGAAGINNTAIGYNASFGASGSGGNNTCIGYNSSYSSGTVANEFTLGNSSIATLRCAVTSITSLSDERDKSEIKDISYGLDFIDSLQPREFVWDNRAETDTDGEEFYSANKGKKDFGFIAQEVQSVDDDTLRLVYDENPDKLELSYGKLVPILVQAIKELKAEVELLKG